MALRGAVGNQVKLGDFRMLNLEIVLVDTIYA
jgi:hypothetical protein